MNKQHFLLIHWSNREKRLRIRMINIKGAKGSILISYLEHKNFGCTSDIYRTQSNVYDGAFWLTYLTAKIYLCTVYAIPERLTRALFKQLFFQKDIFDEMIHGNQLSKFSTRIFYLLTHFWPMFYFKLPENKSELLAFWCLQGI